MAAVLVADSCLIWILVLLLLMESSAVVDLLLAVSGIMASLQSFHRLQRKHYRTA